MRAAGTEQQRLKHRATYQRLYAHDGGAKTRHVAVPDDVERRHVHAPCTFCGTNALSACKHRPWLLQA